MRSPLLVINGTIRVLAPDIPKFIRSTNVCAAETVKEAGCLYYHASRSLTERNLFHLAEGWADEAALDAHLASPHFKLAMREVAAVTLEAVTMKQYSVAGEKDLAHLTMP